MHSSPRTPTLRPSRLRSASALVTTAALLTGTVAVAAVVTAPGASAAVGAHDPIGSVETVVARGSVLTVTGWAGDADAQGADIPVSAVLDGTTTIARTLTSIAKPKTAAKHHLTGTPGFSLAVPLPSSKKHTVCVVAGNVGAGAVSVLRCIPTPVGTTLSGNKVAQHNPVGDYVGAWAHKQSVHIRGWSYDPDLVSRRETVVLYMDGSSVATMRTTKFSDRPDEAGPNSLFDITVPVSTGNHVACLWAVNVGIGDNTYLGCKAIDTRGKPGTGPVTQPTLNRKVLAEAKKHIGQRYVWATEGPKTFDCSGLVMYSYRKNGFQTPRVARDQFHAARLIPQSRAVPGDLVFYATSEGLVHHVGIYSGPGMSVAAIDTAEGVDWQRIYPNDTTYYGSFTHT